MTGDAGRSCVEVAREAALSALACVGLGSGEGPTGAPFDDWWRWWDAQPEEATARRLVRGFALSRAETELIVLLLAAETSEEVARALVETVTSVGGAAGGGVPFWLAGRTIDGLGPVVLAASGPLVRLSLVEVTDAPRIECRLRLAEPLLDRLLGQEVVDPDLAPLVALLPDPSVGMREPLDHDPAPGTDRTRLAEQLATVLGARGPLGVPPLVLARRSHPPELGAALRRLGLIPWVLDARDLPDDPGSLSRLALRWTREAALDAGILVVHHPSPGRPPRSLAVLADRVLGHVVLAGDQPPEGLLRGVHVLHEEPDGPDVMLMRWARELGPERTRRVGPGLGRIATHFRLEDDALARAVASAGPRLDAAPSEPCAEAVLWHEAARSTTPTPRPGLRILEPAYTWDDLVLPPDTEATLRRVEVHVRHAVRVLDDWGFATRLGGRHGWRGRGVAALFAGPSGTGKTMAAEVIAASLDLRVLALDLSQVISKYVGETSKNIAAAFEEAERTGAVMVWNEGDAVWGSRGGVGNAVDRHVNAEVGDLLQRIEEFSGFTLVTTNVRQAIDPAFLRRFRFIVDFPMPSEAERLRLWRRAFPDATPVEPLAWEELARLPLSGGSIRNVALGAAFLAAAAGTRVDRTMLEAELAQELRKHDLPMPRLSWAAS